MNSSYAVETEENWQAWYADAPSGASVTSPWFANDGSTATTYVNATPNLDATAWMYDSIASPLQPLGTSHFQNDPIQVYGPWTGCFEPLPYELHGMQRNNSSTSSTAAGGFSQSSDDDSSTQQDTTHRLTIQGLTLPKADVPQHSFPCHGLEQTPAMEYSTVERTAEKPRSVGFACSSEHQKVDPPKQADAHEGPPRQNCPRWAGDEYTPRWIRGDGIERAGWCGWCPEWFKMKDSAYWYHMHYSHGISCATGRRYDPPEARRPGQGAAAREALCGVCKRWIYIGRSDRAFFRHAYKCHAKDKPIILSPRTAPKGASPCRVSKRHG